VKKLDANSYSTAMNGLKFKLAHKRANKDQWNSGDKAQRNHLIKILKGFIEELEKEPLEEFVASEENMTRTKKQMLADAKKKSAGLRKKSAVKKQATRSAGTGSKVGVRKKSVRKKVSA
jgi:hypothetical protein